MGVGGFPTLGIQFWDTKDDGIFGVYIGVPYLGQLLGGPWDLVITCNWN